MSGFLAKNRTNPPIVHDVLIVGGGVIGLSLAYGIGAKIVEWLNGELSSRERLPAIGRLELPLGRD